jgi:hypothetical protein
MVTGLDGDGAVAPSGSDEFLDAPTGLVLDPVRYGHGCEHHTEVGFDRVAGAVVDRAGLEIVLGHSEGLLDAPQLVVSIDDELRTLGGELVVYPFQPAKALVLASNVRLTDFVAPESWM